MHTVYIMHTQRETNSSTDGGTHKETLEMEMEWNTEKFHLSHAKTIDAAERVRINPRESESA